MSAAESSERKHGVKGFFSNVLRPKKSRQTLRKKAPVDGVEQVPAVPKLAPLEEHRQRVRAAGLHLNTQLGENLDYTEILHKLGLNEPFDADDSHYAVQDNRPPGEPAVASLSPELWGCIVQYLNPREAASLALASRTLYMRLGCTPFQALNLEENYQYKIEFLVSLDRYFPHHLLCFPCAKFHRRTQEGRERLRPADVLNPLFNCPNARNPLRPQPRHRITHNYVLYYSFVQLVMRAHRLGPRYGLSPDSLGRRWKRDGWNFTTRYHIHNGHLLMRVTAQTFADPGLTPAAQRMLLYSRDDYWPFFSACAHWRDGELMSVCKCALSHIPVPRPTEGLQGVENRVKDMLAAPSTRGSSSSVMTASCGKCRPKRRCPECPTEYLIEIKLTEDRSEIKNVHFRHAIVVTRWSDLGDGMSPMSPEWSACDGYGPGYDSFTAIGNRAISGIFEAAFTFDTVPGQRVISLNPTGVKKGEAGNDWY
ncbi:hypothetical protein DTO207G8_8364 [Paecilomyces variotii]|nr:hypothetical protein DTO169E5_7694 [Paecilomyces variotii]KAJ9247049.1 hypothetical protein DTO207G8_8364 [Paecilomyces variotii]